jgi:eukaryotic-like serine/threonine-protein kinase
MRSAAPVSDGRAADLEPAPAWLVDGRYLTSAMIGQGGMADVFLARDTVLRRAVAVKVFRQRTALLDVWERSQQEVCTVARLNHPNLVTVFDAGRHTGEHALSGPYLVMEFVDGPSLAQQMSLGPLDPHEVASIGAQIAAALCYVHAHDIVHCDVKPANVLLARAGSGLEAAWTAKLTDFGIAEARDVRSCRTAGVTIGTASYLSPEQVRSEPLGPASDIYSLGLVLLEALTGRRVYDGEPVDAAVARLRHPPQVPRSLGTEWVALLTGMIARAPTARPSAEAVTATLRDIAADETPEPVGLLESLFAADADDSSEPSALPEPAPPHRARKVLVRTAYAALAPAAAVATVLLVGNPLTGSGHTPPAAAAAAAPAAAPGSPASAAPVPPAPVQVSSIPPAAGGVAAVRLAAPQPSAKPRAAVPRAAHGRPATVSVGTGGQLGIPEPLKPPKKPKNVPPPGKPKQHGPGGAHHGNGGQDQGDRNAAKG